MHIKLNTGTYSWICTEKYIFLRYLGYIAGPSGRAVQGVGLRPLAS